MAGLFCWGRSLRLGFSTSFVFTGQTMMAPLAWYRWLNGHLSFAPLKLSLVCIFLPIWSLGQVQSSFTGPFMLVPTHLIVGHTVLKRAALSAIGPLLAEVSRFFSRTPLQKSVGAGRYCPPEYIEFDRSPCENF